MCYRSVIHLNYPVDVSGDNLSADEDEFVARGFPLRSGKKDGRRDLFHITTKNMFILINSRDEYHNFFSITGR